MTFNPVDEIKRLIAAPLCSMGKEHDEVLAHNLDASLEFLVVLSFELQLNYWDVCGLVTFSVSKVQEVNLWTILWSRWAKGTCENKDMRIYTRKALTIEARWQPDFDQDLGTIPPS